MTDKQRIDAAVAVLNTLRVRLSRENNIPAYQYATEAQDILLGKP